MHKTAHRLTAPIRTLDDMAEIMGMKPNERQILALLQQDPRFRLAGSRAKGTNRPDSDWDFETTEDVQAMLERLGFDSAQAWVVRACFPPHVRQVWDWNHRIHVIVRRAT